MSGTGTSSRQHPKQPLPSLPYPIPGPAGTECGHSGRNRQWSQPTESGRKSMDAASVSRTFDAAPWHSLLKSFEFRPYGDEMMMNSVALAKSKAFRNDLTKSSLAVRLENMEFIGKEATVILADPTGTICGSVLAEVFEVYKGIFEDGAVVMLQEVFAVMYPDRRAIGFKLDLNKSVHLTIRRDNIVRVFGLDEEFAGDMRPLQELYTEEALQPPKANYDTLRQQRSSRFLKSGKAASSLERNLPIESKQDTRAAAPSKQSIRGGGNGRNARYRVNRGGRNRVNRGRGGGYTESLHVLPAQSPNNSRRMGHIPYSQVTPLTTQSMSLVGSNGGVKRPSNHVANSTQPYQRPRLDNEPARSSPDSAQVNSKANQIDLDEAQLDELLGEIDVDGIVAQASQRMNRENNVDKETTHNEVMIHRIASHPQPAVERSKGENEMNASEIDGLFDGLGD